MSKRIVAGLRESEEGRTEWGGRWWVDLTGPDGGTGVSCKSGHVRRLVYHSFRLDVAFDPWLRHRRVAAWGVIGVIYL
jgi:hypothetical protein